MESPFGELTRNLDDDLNPSTLEPLPVDPTAPDRRNAIANADSQEVRP